MIRVIHAGREIKADSKSMVIRNIITGSAIIAEVENHKAEALGYTFASGRIAYNGKIIENLHINDIRHFCADEDNYNESDHCRMMERYMMQEMPGLIDQGMDKQDMIDWFSDKFDCDPIEEDFNAVYDFY